MGSTNDKDDATDLSEALQRLLFRGSGATVQVLYITLADGRQHVFLGSPLADEDCELIVDFVLGETIDPVVFSTIASVFGGQITAH
jgi:hypothetical protein